LRQAVGDYYQPLALRRGCRLYRYVWQGAQEPVQFTGACEEQDKRSSVNEHKRPSRANSDGNRPDCEGVDGSDKYRPASVDWFSEPFAAK
jgi:hypothetical protein